MPGHAVTAAEKGLESVTLSFDEVADIYDDDGGLMPDSVIADAVAVMTRWVALDAGARVVDLGAGTGKLAIPFAAHGYDVVAVDVAPAMLARLRAKPGGDRVRIEVADARRLPFDDGSVDLLATSMALQVIPGALQALEEIRRVLRSSGRLLYCELHRPPGSSERQFERAFNSFAVEERCMLPTRPGATRDEILSYLTAHRFRWHTRTACAWQRRTTVGAMIASFAERERSFHWSASSQLLDGVLPRLRTWAAERYGGDDVELVDHLVYDVTIAEAA